jgi:hypothetical protein
MSNTIMAITVQAGDVEVLNENFVSLGLKKRGYSSRLNARICEARLITSARERYFRLTFF